MSRGEKNTANTAYSAQNRFSFEMIYHCFQYINLNTFYPILLKLSTIRSLQGLLGRPQGISSPGTKYSWCQYNNFYVWLYIFFFVV